MAMLQKLLGLLMSRSVLTIVGVLLLVGLIWFGGPYVGLSRTGVYLVLGGIALFVACFLLLQRLVIARSARQMEERLKAQGIESREDALPSEQGEIEALERQFGEALTALKSSKGGSSALYQFPWYVIIGPPGSGKSTLINESNLNLPYMKHGRGEIRGVGGTRNCDWFFTDQAILLDTAGRYMTEMEDREEWLAFLSMLEEGRKHQPINGILIAISIPEIIAASDSELEKHAENIRNRLDELTKQLQVICPVYLIFTKCDLLDGFVEFFGSYDKDERAQVWGCTVDPDPEGKHDFVAAFDSSFGELYDRLCSERVVQLAVDRAARKRQRIYSFPLQFALARKRLGQLVDAIAQPNPYQETAFFRGFYFCSGTQEGQPIDAVTSAIGEALGVNVSTEMEPVETRKQCYFVNHLFTKVVFPDQHLARRTVKIEKRRRWGRFLTLRGSVAAAALFFAGMIMSVAGNCSEIATAEDQLTRFRDGLRQRATAKENALQQYATLAAYIQALEGRRDSFRHGFGLNRIAALQEEAIRLYCEQYRECFIEPTEQALRASLEATVKEWDQQYKTLKQQGQKFSPPPVEQRRFLVRVGVYRALRDPNADMPEGAKEVLDGLWAFDGLPPPSTTGSPAGSEVAKNLAGQLAFFLRQVVRSPSYKDWRSQVSGVIYKEVLRRKDDILQRVNEAVEVYEKIKRDVTSSELTLAELVDGPAAVSGLEASVGVPSIFVVGHPDKSTFNDRLTKRVSEALENRGLPPEPNSTAGQDLAKAVRAHYQATCDLAWRAFVGSVRPAPLGGVGNASVQLETYLDPGASPYIKLYAAARDKWPGMGEASADGMKNVLAALAPPQILFKGFGQIDIDDLKPEAITGLSLSIAEAHRRVPTRLVGEVAKTGWVSGCVLKLWPAAVGALQRDVQSKAQASWSKIVYDLDVEGFPLRPDAERELEVDQLAPFGPGGAVARFLEKVSALERLKVDGQPILRTDKPFDVFRAMVRRLGSALFVESDLLISGTLGLTSTPQVSNLLLTVEAAQPSEFNTRRKPPRPGSRTHVWSFKWTPKPVVLELSGITGRSGQVSGQKAVFDTAAYTGKTWGLLRLIRAGDPALDKKTGQVNCVWRARKSKDSTETFELEGYFKADGEANPFDPAFFDGFKLPNNLYEAPK